ncbi:hypothetical protein GCM10027396_22660 [Insolitispirillum peregrinum]|uniref:hypothetical protein n=1 Tax=Insolitispirillum peregrinum TaxID=80876 RepID=UPI0036D432F4
MVTYLFYRDHLTSLWDVVAVYPNGERQVLRSFDHAIPAHRYLTALRSRDRQTRSVRGMIPALALVSLSCDVVH